MVSRSCRPITKQWRSNQLANTITRNYPPKETRICSFINLTQNSNSITLIMKRNKIETKFTSNRNGHMLDIDIVNETDDKNMFK